nr:MAG TPA: hypothetical protein [Caudoviricetes sp.]
MILQIKHRKCLCIAIRKRLESFIRHKAHPLSPLILSHSGRKDNKDAPASAGNTDEGCGDLLKAPTGPRGYYTRLRVK